MSASAIIVVNNILSTDILRRNSGAIVFAPKVQSAPNPTAMPNHAVPAVSPRNQNAR